MGPAEITLAVGVLAAFGSLLFWFSAGSASNRRAARLLGSLLALVTMMYALRYAILTDHPAAPLIVFLPVALAWLHGPLMELFVRSAFFETDEERVWHTLRPAAIVGGLALLLHTGLYLREDWPRSMDSMHEPAGPFRMYLAGLILAAAAFCSLNLWRTFAWLRMYRRRYRQFRAGSPRGALREMYAFLALCVLWLATPLISELTVALLATAEQSNNAQPWYLLPVTAFTIVPLMFLALRRAMGPGERLPALASALESPKATELAEPAGLSKETAAVADALREALEDSRAYLDDELSLMDLAQTLGVSRHQLSGAIGQAFGTNFYGLINRYRVAAVRELLADPDLADETILDLAFRAGFASKGVFNRVFKAETGQTPGAFREAALAK